MGYLMRAHVIENGKIVNTIVVDSLSDRPNLVEATEGQKGDRYENGRIIPVPRNPVQKKDRLDRLLNKLSAKSVLTPRDITEIEGNSR